jgi:hypothetical protein
MSPGEGSYNKVVSMTESKSQVVKWTLQRAREARLAISWTFLLKPSGYYMHILKLYILPTECVVVFRMVLTINSEFFPKQH